MKLKENGPAVFTQSICNPSSSYLSLSLMTENSRSYRSEKKKFKSQWGSLARWPSIEDIDIGKAKYGLPTITPPTGSCK